MDIPDGGGPEGGYVRKTDGWYAWDRQWFEVATYTKLHDKKLIWRYDEHEQEQVKVVDIQDTKNNNTKHN